MAVLIETSLGDITVDLFTEERPRSSLNFLKLCKIKYYNFSLFHSVQRNLVAQTGDPTGTGRGGQSVFAHLYGDQAVYFDMETVPRIKHRKRGLVSMVNNGNNGHGSQFFFTLGEDLDYLDGVHTVIGEVAEGMDVLDKINEAYCDEEHRPYKDIRIYHTIILDDPYSDPEELVIPDRSPEPTKEQLDSGRIGADEDIDDTKGLTEAEVQESLDKKEAQANAQILEMVGDLPDVDVKPPDTVLFVCKLNPVTTSEDLEIIFSRFGKILSCEVIKDQKTEESLQYAFVEFEKPEDCESAYFKMDNVLIDDRRIHVDFSQSVSKLQFEGDKGKKAGLFGSKFKLKDNSRKDNKYDLVFEERSGSGSKKNRSSDKKDGKRSKHRSRSRSGDRSPVGRREKQDSRSPVDPKKKHRDISDDGSDRRRETDRRKPHKDKTDVERKKRDYKGDYPDSDSEDDRRKEKSRDKHRHITAKKKKSDRNDRSERCSEAEESRKRHPDRNSDRERYKYDDRKKEKSYSQRKKPASDSSDDDSPEKKRRKKRMPKSDSESEGSSDERSKFSRKSGQSRKDKSKYRKDSSSDSESDDKSRKRKSTKEYSRESNQTGRDQEDRDKNYRNRDRDDDKYRSRHSDYRQERSRDDRYSDKDRSEKRYRDRR